LNTKVLVASAKNRYNSAYVLDKLVLNGIFIKILGQNIKEL